MDKKQDINFWVREQDISCAPAGNEKDMHHLGNELELIVWVM